MRNLAILFIVLFSSCLRLDDQMFNSDNSITDYLYDVYAKGELAELYGNTQYEIQPSKIKLFTLVSDDNGSSETIYAMYVGDIDSIATDTVIMYCHGNKNHMDTYWNRTKLLANIGGKHRYGVLTFDYRGYGKSGGKSTESSLYADGEACLKWLQSKGLTSSRLIIYGYSLGSSVATELTANPRVLTPSKLILEAPFASTETMTADGSGLALPASYVTNIRVNNAEKIKKVQQPLLWMHGMADDFLKINSHGELVFKNYKGRAGTPVRVSSAGHSDVPRLIGYPQYLNYLETIITLP